MTKAAACCTNVIPRLMRRVYLHPITRCFRRRTRWFQQTRRVRARAREKKQQTVSAGSTAGTFFFIAQAYGPRNIPGMISCSRGGAATPSASARIEPPKRTTSQIMANYGRLGMTQRRNYGSVYATVPASLAAFHTPIPATATTHAIRLASAFWAVLTAIPARSTCSNARARCDPKRTTFELWMTPFSAPFPMFHARIGSSGSEQEAARVRCGVKSQPCRGVNRPRARAKRAGGYYPGASCELHEQPLVAQVITRYSTARPVLGKAGDGAAVRTGPGHGRENTNEADLVLC